MYTSLIWSPHLSTEMKRLETVQNKFLCDLAFKMWDPFSHDYSQIVIQFKVPTLKFYRIREVNDALFAHKLVYNNGIDCLEQQNLLIERVLTYNLKNQKTFDEQITFRSNYTFYATIPRLPYRQWHMLPNYLNDVAQLQNFKRLLEFELFSYQTVLQRKCTMQMKVSHLHRRHICT